MTSRPVSSLPVSASNGATGAEAGRICVPGVGSTPPESACAAPALPRTAVVVSAAAQRSCAARVRRDMDTHTPLMWWCGARTGGRAASGSRKAGGGETLSTPSPGTSHIVIRCGSEINSPQTRQNHRIGRWFPPIPLHTGMESARRTSRNTSATPHHTFCTTDHRQRCCADVSSVDAMPAHRRPPAARHGQEPSAASLGACPQACRAAPQSLYRPSRRAHTAAAAVEAAEAALRSCTSAGPAPGLR